MVDNGTYSKRAELHCHSIKTRLSYLPMLFDAVQTEEDIINRCIAQHISVLAITDHDTLDGYRNAKRIIEKRHLNLLLISGCEISSANGHILAYNIESEIPKGLTAAETVKRIHDQGGFATAAHPFMIFGLGNLIETIPFDAIEGYNSMIPPWCNKKAAEAAVSLNLPITVGSDAHLTEDIGNAVMLFPPTVNSASDVTAAIRNRLFANEFRHAHIIRMAMHHIRMNYTYRLIHKGII